jgi:hypothetical protein
MVPVTTTPNDILLREVGRTWAALLSECREKIQAEGFSLDGCLAKTILGSLDDAFRRDAGRFLDRYEFTETNLATLGVVRWLGAANGRKTGATDFSTGVEQLSRKKPPASGISYLESLRLLLGLALGAAADPVTEQTVAWAKSLLKSFMDRRPGDARAQVFGRWAMCKLGETEPDWKRMSTMLSSSGGAEGSEAVAALWAMERLIPAGSLTASMMERKGEWIGKLCSLDTRGLDVLDCAMLADVLDRLCAEGARLLPVRDVEYLIRVLRRFPQCLKRERENLRNEDDVQRVLWTMLRAHFDDLVDEEYLRRFGLKNYRLDIGVRSLRTIVEAKYVRPGEGLGKFQDQVLADVQGYLKSTEEFDKLVVLIYDCSHKLSVNTQFVTDMKRVSGIEDVIVVPSVDLGGRRASGKRKSGE